MTKYTRRDIADLLPQIRPELERLVKTNDLMGFKRLLGNYSAWMDSETKDQLIEMFKNLASAWHEAHRKSR